MRTMDAYIFNKIVHDIKSNLAKKGDISQYSFKLTEDSHIALSKDNKFLNNIATEGLVDKKTGNYDIRLILEQAKNIIKDSHIDIDEHANKNQQPTNRKVLVSRKSRILNSNNNNNNKNVKPKETPSNVSQTASEVTVESARVKERNAKGTQRERYTNNVRRNSVSSKSLGSWNNSAFDEVKSAKEIRTRDLNLNLKHLNVTSHNNCKSGCDGSNNSNQPPKIEYNNPNPEKKLVNKNNNKSNNGKNNSKNNKKYDNKKSGSRKSHQHKNPIKSKSLTNSRNILTNYSSNSSHDESNASLVSSSLSSLSSSSLTSSSDSNSSLLNGIRHKKIKYTANGIIGITGPTGATGSMGVGGPTGPAGIQGVPASSHGDLSLFFNPFSVNRVTTFGTFGASQKWSGAVQAANGKLYCIPSAATSVLIIDPVTLTYDTTTISNLPVGVNKWQSGVLAPNGKIYCPPSNHESVLIIDPLNDTYDITTITGLVGANKWYSGSLATNGKIYAAPDSSTSVLIIDPKTNTANTTLISGFTSLPNKWKGFIQGTNSKLYGIASSSTSILILDPTTNIADTTTISGLSAMPLKWDGACLANNGKIYCAPFNHSSVLIIDPQTNMIDTMSISDITGENKFKGIVAAPDNLLYAISFDATFIAIIDPTTNTVDTTTISGLSVNGGKWSGGILAQTGKVFGIPFGSNILTISTGLQTLPTDMLFSSYFNKY